MNANDEITRETMQLCLALVLTDLKLTELAMLAPEKAFAIAVSANLTAEQLADAMLQLSAIRQARNAVMLSRLQPADGAKPS